MVKGRDAHLGSPIDRMNFWGGKEVRSVESEPVIIARGIGSLENGLQETGMRGRRGKSGVDKLFHSKLTDGYTAERNVPHYVPHYGI